MHRSYYYLLLWVVTIIVLQYLHGMRVWYKIIQKMVRNNKVEWGERGSDQIGRAVPRDRSNTWLKNKV
jgi:hypothetical protein